MTTSAPPVTRLCTHTLTSLHYRDANLVEDLMGQKTFTEVMLMQILGRTPRPVDLRITDVVLIVLMEHGLTPSAIATRLIYMSAPENLQGAVSAGLLAVGSSFVGTMENCARLLDRILAAADPDAEALEIARHYKGLKSPVPGFGHHLHKPVDPRAYKLLELGRAEPQETACLQVNLEMLALQAPLGQDDFAKARNFDQARAVGEGLGRGFKVARGQRDAPFQDVLALGKVRPEPFPLGGKVFPRQGHIPLDQGKALLLPVFQLPGGNHQVVRRDGHRFRLGPDGVDPLFQIEGPPGDVGLSLELDFNGQRGHGQEENKQESCNPTHHRPPPRRSSPTRKTPQNAPSG